jgi:hypothetical protein
MVQLASAAAAAVVGRLDDGFMSGQASSPAGHTNGSKEGRKQVVARLAR